MEINELTDERERQEAGPILRQLWTDADPDDILAWTSDDEYHLFGGFVDSKLAGVAGVRVADFLLHNAHTTAAQPVAGWHVRTEDSPVVVATGEWGRWPGPVPSVLDAAGSLHRNAVGYTEQIPKTTTIQ